MRNLIYFLIILLVTTLEVKTQTCNWSDNLILNTGYNQNTATLLAPGTIDPNWRLINLPIVTSGSPGNVAGIRPLPSQVALNQSYVVTNSWSWNNNHVPNVRPISANNNRIFGDNNFNINQPYRFVREFCVKQTDSININVFLKGDDTARITLYDQLNVPLVSYTTINGLNASTYTINNPNNFNNSMFNGYNLNENLLLTPGTYTIEVDQLNSNGFLMGWILNGSISSISNQNSLAYSPICCDVGTIGLIKYFDQNCNQQIDVGESIQQNMTFNLMQGNTIIATSTTNPITGELFFRNIPFGTYTIKEIGSSFFLSNNPGNIVVDDNNKSHYFILYNCPKEESIKLKKIMDNNCNGKFDKNDQIGSSGYSFTISNGSISETAVTDSNGNATFYNLPIGNYTVTENVNPLSSHNQPYQNPIYITNNSNIDTVLFFNCPSEEPNIDCCQTELDIWNYWGTPDPLPVQTTTVSGVDLSYAEETFELHKDAAIPITELKVNVQDVEFEYNYDQCAECIDNPALWGSIYSSDNTMGTAPSVLTQNPPFSLANLVNGISNNKNTREIVWENPNGAMLKNGDTFKVGYILPPLSEIPCCAVKAKVCTKISWKDANCNICEIYTCSEIDLANKITSLNIKSETKGCCQRVLTANSDVPATYLWDTGETTKSITVSQNGTYAVTATDGTGSSVTQMISVNDLLAGKFPTLDFTPVATPDLGNNFIIYDYTKPQGAPYAYNATKYTLWIFNRNDTDPYGGAFKKITGVAECGEGFKNGDIQWDGRDDYGNKVKGDAYNFVLRLENCNNEKECLSYSSYLAGTTRGCGKSKNKKLCRNDCKTCTQERLISFLPWPKYWNCTKGVGIRDNRIRHMQLQW